VDSLNLDRLTERQDRILDFVVREYVDTATPVASKTIVRRRDLGVSSATVRGEMAHLETLGYLTHPHTSAGRIPTAMGYQYFVEYLMEEATLPLIERRMIEHQFHQVDMEVEHWMKLAGAILTSKANTASLVTTPRSRRSQFKRLELTRVTDRTVLLSLVLREGLVRRQVIELEASQIAGALRRLANELNAVFLDLRCKEIEDKTPQLKRPHRVVGEHVAQLMDDVDVQGSLELQRYGFAQILRQPEFTATEQVEKVVGILEHPGHLESIVAEVGLSHSGVQVIIGGADRWPQMTDFSLVLARYGVTLQTTGVLGVLGPIRMPYSRNVPMVSYVASLMSELVQGHYG